MKPNTTIYLAEGVYTIKAPIFVAGLVFEKKDPEKPVYIVGSDGPVVNVVLNSGEFVMFKKLIFLHTGVMIANKFIENAPNEPIYQTKASKKCVAEFCLNASVDSVIFVHSGGCALHYCTINMKSMPKNMKSKITSVAVMPRSALNCNNCTFLGNETNHDAGIVAV